MLKKRKRYSIYKVGKDVVRNKVEKAKKKFRIKDFFEATNGNTTASLGLITKNNDTVMVDCELSAYFTGLPYAYSIDHGNTAIILYFAIYGVNIDESCYSIDNIQGEDWNDLIARNNDIVIQFCNQHEYEDRHTEIWLPEYLTPYQLSELERINEEIKDICKDPFFESNHIEFSFAFWNSEINDWDYPQAEPMINSLDDLITYIKEHNIVQDRTFTA